MNVKSLKKNNHGSEHVLQRLWLSGRYHVCSTIDDVSDRSPLHDAVSMNTRPRTDQQS
jgi:hypothetical protein